MHVRTVLEEFSALIISVAWSADGSLTATGCLCGIIKVLDAVTGAVKIELQGHTASSPVFSLAWKPGGAQVCSGDDRGTCRLWDVGTGQLLHEQTKNDGFMCPVVSWSPDRSLVATGTQMGTVRVRDATTGDEVHELHHAGYGAPRTSPMNCVAWSPDGSMLVSGCPDCSVRVWDADTGTVKYRVQCRSLCSVHVVAWRPDGRLLAIGDDFGSLRVWPVGVAVTDVRRIQVASCPRLAWSPNGQVLVAAHNKAATICDVSEYASSVKQNGVAAKVG